jgi:cytochrome oxidase Cu insertion factor (SCO1/SenC/PrrC family)
MFNWKTIGLLLLMLLLAACGGAAEETVSGDTASGGGGDTAMADEEMMDEEMSDEAMGEEMNDDGEMPEDEMMDEEMSEEAMDKEIDTHDDMADEEMADETMADDEMLDDEKMDDMALPAWQTMTLTDALTGESFTFADFAGQPVLVEPMATWCGNCRRQLGNVQEARAQLGDEVVFVALSVETNISDAELAEYALNEGFDFKFAVLSEDGLRALVDTFGTTAANPPSTPHFIIRADGSWTDLVTGSESAEELIKALTAAQG